MLTLVERQSKYTLIFPLKSKTAKQVEYKMNIIRGSLKCGANFLYYWIYKQKNGLKTGLDFRNLFATKQNSSYREV